jgi:hypothetical protein
MDLAAMASTAAYSSASGQQQQSQQQQQLYPLASYEQSATLVFHQTEYLLHACVRYQQQQSQQSQATPEQQQAAPMPVLVIEAEQRSNGHRWTGEFSAKCTRSASAPHASTCSRLCHLCTLAQ